MKSKSSIAKTLSCAMIAVATPVMAQTASEPPACQSDRFMQPELIQALCDADFATLNKARLNSVIYVAIMVEATASPNVIYRIGPEAELALDPRLSGILNGKIMTSPEILNEMMTTGMNAFMGAMVGLAEQRQKSEMSGSFDPAAEIAAMNRGEIIAMQDINLIKADAEYDAKKLLYMAQADFEGFMLIYRGIQEYVYHGI